jgi:hypothetical protein
MERVRSEKIRLRERAYYLTNREAKIAYQKEWASKNKDKTAFHKMKYNYGINKEQYEELMKLQGNVCKICSSAGKLHVDHNHSTGKVRGLLCAKCNKALGLFKENKNSLAKAIEYLDG